MLTILYFRCIVQQILENIPVLKVKAFELVDNLPTISKQEDDSSNQQIIDYTQVDSMEIPLSPILRSALEDLPLVQSDMTIFAEVTNAPEQQNADLGTGIHLSEDKKLPGDGKSTLLVGTKLLSKKEVTVLILHDLIAQLMLMQNNKYFYRLLIKLCQLCVQMVTLYPEKNPHCY